MKFRHSIILAMMVIALMAVSCGGNDPAKPDPKPDPVPDPDPIEKKLTHEQEFDGKDYHDVPKDGWEKEVKARATAFARISWTPLAQVPSAGSEADWFPAGQAIEGIPYSNVPSELGFVGRDISFYTFLSAVHNPKSKLYTVNYKKSTSKGKAPFYGTVCSATVPYAYGSALQETTDLIYHGQSTQYELCANQDLSKIELFDSICWYTDVYEEGHVMMVYDIRRDKDGNITGFSIYESTGQKTRILDYTYAELDKKLKALSIPAKFYAYKPKMKDPLPAFMEQDSNYPTSFPTELCLDRGDKVTLAQGTDAVINILATGYTSIELYKDDALYGAPKTLSGTDDVTFSDLPVGLYKACLVKDGGVRSGYTYFEIGSLTFTTTTNGSTTITIMPGDNTSIPCWITTNATNYTGAKPLEKISEGVWKYTGDVDGATHARVRFAGKYSTYQGNSVKMTKE